MTAIIFRIPLPQFNRMQQVTVQHEFVSAGPRRRGKRLMELHIDYEKQPEYKLEQIENPKADVTFASSA